METGGARQYLRPARRNPAQDENSPGDLAPCAPEPERGCVRGEGASRRNVNDQPIPSSAHAGTTSPSPPRSGGEGRGEVVPRAPGENTYSLFQVHGKPRPPKLDAHWDHEPRSDSFVDSQQLANTVHGEEVPKAPGEISKSSGAPAFRFPRFPACSVGLSASPLRLLPLCAFAPLRSSPKIRAIRS